MKKPTLIMLVTAIVLISVLSACSKNNTGGAVIPATPTPTTPTTSTETTTEPTTTTTTEPTTEEPTPNDPTKMYSSDGKFYVQVDSKKIEGGYVTFFPGSDIKSADRITLGGSGVKDISEAEVWITVAKKAPRLKVIMKPFESVYDAPLKGSERGTITIKIKDKAGKDIANDIKLGIIPSPI